MCTLAVAFQTDRRWPLVVAANRDERLLRAAEGWGLRDPLPFIPSVGPRSGPESRYAAPKDLVAGGTWIGLSAAGVFAAVTNVHTGAAPDPARRSRGDLVPFALAAPTATEAFRRLTAGATLDAGAWNPFHLLVADASSAFLWRFDGDSAVLEPLAPGLHILTERAHDGSDPRGAVVRARWPLDPSVPRLLELLSTHDAAPERAICVHAEPTYGTRSSTILRLAPTLAASELYAADGPPCRAPLEDRSSLLSALARA